MHQQVVVIEPQAEIESQIRYRLPPILNISRLFITCATIVEQELICERELQNRIRLSIREESRKRSRIGHGKLKVFFNRKAADFKTGFKGMFLGLMRN